MKIKYGIGGLAILLVLIIITRITPISNLCKTIDQSLTIQIDSSLRHTILVYPEFTISESNIPHLSAYGKELGEKLGDKDKTSKRLCIKTEEDISYALYNDSIKKPKTIELKKIHSRYTLFNIAGRINVKKVDSLFKEQLIEAGIYVNSLTIYHNCDSGKVEFSQKDTLSYFNAPFQTKVIKAGIKKEVEFQSFVKYPYSYLIKTIIIENIPYIIAIILLITALIYLCILKRTLKLRAIENERREKEIEILVETAKRKEKERIEEKIREAKSQHALLAEEVDNINNVCRTLNYCYKGKMLRTLSRQNKELMSLFLHKPNHTLLQSEIVIGLWGGMVNGYKERLKKCIQRFRDNLLELTPELKLITIKGEGYMLEIPNPGDIDEIVVIEPLNFKGTPEELNKVRKIEIQKIKAVEDSKKQKEEELAKSQDITETDPATEN